MSDIPSLPPESLRLSYRGDHTADRGYESYINDLGVDLRPGEHVLDVGAAAGTFAREVWQHSNGMVTVDSLDTFSSDDVVAGRIHFKNSRGGAVQTNEYWPNNRIVGDITKGIDVPNESYDHVVSSYAVPVWVNTPEEMFFALTEMLRVCKVGGDVRLFPMEKNIQGLLSGFDYPEILARAKNVVQSHGHNFRLEQVTDSTGTLIENVYRVVIEKGGSSLPTVEEFQRLAMIARLTIALRKFAIS